MKVRQSKTIQVKKNVAKQNREEPTGAQMELIDTVSESNRAK